MNNPNIAHFDSLSAAKTWRSQQGGWLFSSEDGQVIWFNLTFTPSMVIAHKATSGLSGQLI